MTGGLKKGEETIAHGTGLGREISLVFLKHLQNYIFDPQT